MLPPTASATLVIQVLLAGRARPARQAHTRHSRAQELVAAAPRVWVPKTNNNAQCTQYWVVAYMSILKFKLYVLSGSNIIVWDTLTMP